MKVLNPSESIKPTQYSQFENPWHARIPQCLVSRSIVVSMSGDCTAHKHQAWAAVANARRLSPTTTSSEYQVLFRFSSSGTTKYPPSPGFCVALFSMITRNGYRTWLLGLWIKPWKLYLAYAHIKKTKTRVLQGFTQELQALEESGSAIRVRRSSMINSQYKKCLLWLKGFYGFVVVWPRVANITATFFMKRTLDQTFIFIHSLSTTGSLAFAHHYY